MATRKDIAEFLLEQLGAPDRFAVRRMFGEYAVYADGRTVALICDDRLFVKIVPASEEFLGAHERGAPFPGAKPYYVMDEDQWSAMRTLPRMLIAIAAALPAPGLKRTGRKKGSAK